MSPARLSAIALVVPLAAMFAGLAVPSGGHVRSTAQHAAPGFRHVEPPTAIRGSGAEHMLARSCTLARAEQRQQWGHMGPQDTVLV